MLIVGASSFGMGYQTSFEQEVAQIVDSDEKIHTTGFVNNEDLGKYYASSDLVVLPSTWQEPLGLTMIEAQLAGKPLITTNKGGIPETTSAKNSLLLDVTDDFTIELKQAIAEVLSSLPSWQEKAKVAQKEANARFNEELFYQNMIQALK